MAKIIAVINQKGGVGKTTTVDAICSGLSTKGCKVLSLDLDSQCNYSFTTGIPEGSNNNVLDVLAKEKEISECVRKTDRGDVVPGSSSLVSVDMLIPFDAKDRLIRLKTALDKVRTKYDYIVIDTPPGLGTLTLNALIAADVCVVPAQADIYSLQGVNQLADTINSVKASSNPKLKVAGVLLVKYSGRTIISKDMAAALEKLVTKMDTKVFDAKIRECNPIREAQAVHQGIFQYAPKSNAVNDYSMFLLELLLAN